MVKAGEMVIVRYYDHVLFHDAADLSIMKPIIREALGWLDAEDSTYIRLIWERYAEPTVHEQLRVRSTGLALRKSDIIEMVKVE